MLYLHEDIYREGWIQAKVNDIDPYLLFAVWNAESGFNPNAVGDSNQSFGLGQLYQGGAGGGHTGTELLDLTTNAEMSARYLAECIRATGSEEDGVSAYNQGVGGWNKNGRELNAPYVDGIMATRARIADEGVGRMPVGLKYAIWS